MLMRVVEERDFAEVVQLANWAYRGLPGEAASWNAESAILEGKRLNEDLLREELAEKKDGALLVFRDAADEPLLGTVWVNPEKDGVWYLGLLTVAPNRQDRGLGRQFLEAAEVYVREHRGTKVEMTVLEVRVGLMAWYERRGYAKTGEMRPFPYHDERYGKALRDDLRFVVLEKTL
jgi:ribosomal protein S18 acetylase RimI-like enzyme